MRRPRLFWKQVGRELVLRLEEITHERDQAEIARDEARDAAYASSYDLQHWQARALKAEAAEAQLVEQLARIAEHNLAEQCGWLSLTTGERCGYRDGHRGKCVDSMGRFVPGPQTAKRVGA